MLHLPLDLVASAELTSLLRFSLHSGTQNWTRYSTRGSAETDNHYPWLCSWWYNPGCSWPPLLPGHTAGLWPTCCPPRPHVLSCKAAPQPTSPQPVLLQRALPSQVLDLLNFLAFVLVKFHRLPVRPFLQPVQIPLNGSSVLQHFQCPSLASPASSSKVTEKDVKQHHTLLATGFQ